jgi:ClpP class serine protease
MEAILSRITQPVPLVIVAAVVLVILTAALGWYLTRRRQDIERRQAQKEVAEGQSQSYANAHAAYVNAKAELASRPGHPMVVDIINDISSDIFAGGAPTEIDFSSAVEVLYQIKQAKEHQAIEIILHTLGGYTLAAELVAAALKNHKGPTRAHVPYIAMSGGTMIALATQEVVLGKNAALGPIDTQYFGPFSGESFSTLLSEKSRDAITDAALLRAYEVAKYQRSANARACEILNEAHKKKDGNVQCRVVNELMAANRPHGTRIDHKTAEQLGIWTKEGCDENVYRLVDARVRMIKTYFDPRAERQRERSDTEVESLARMRGASI